MSGDAGLNEPVVFYSKKMTETKNSTSISQGDKICRGL